MSNPITGQESAFPAGKMLVSVSDIEGRFTFANDAYAEVSGYSAQELILQPLSICRHPDVPKWVFDGMWQRLNQGKPWRGILKNRCRNGDHYWVDAFIIPVRKNGVTHEYMSVQLEASADQKARANTEFQRQHPPVRDRFSPSRFLTVKTGVTGGILFVIFSLFVAWMINTNSLKQSSAAFGQLHQDGTMLSLVLDSHRAATTTQNQLLFALRHTPQNTRVVNKDNIDLNEHLNQVRIARQNLEASVTRLTALEETFTKATPESLSEVRGLLASYRESLRNFANKGIAPALSGLENGDFDNAESLIVGELAGLIETLQAQSDHLLKSLNQTAGRHQAELQEAIETGPNQMTYWILFVVAVISTSSILFFHGTMGPLRRAIDAMRRIAEGDLNERLDVYAAGEPGEVLSTLATMQISLKVMLDEIRLASTRVHSETQRLNQSVIAVLNSTEDAHQQASQIIQTLSEVGSDTERLAAVSYSAMELLQVQAGTTPDEALAAAVKEAATLARLNEFAASEIRRMSESIVEHLSVNRETINDAWDVGTNLEKTSRMLQERLAQFD